MARGAVARRRRSDRRSALRVEVTADGLREVGGASRAPNPAEHDASNLEAVEALAASAAGPRSRGRRVLDALTAAGVEVAPPVQTTYDLAHGSLAERAFYAAVLEAGISETRRASWPSEAELGDHGDVVFRADGEGVFRLPDGTLVHAAAGGGWFFARVASPTREAAAEALAAFSTAYPPLYRADDDDSTVPVTFWTNSQFGPTSRLRRIEAQPWSAVEANYPAGVRAELGRVMGDGFEPGHDGQLLLWRGEPGTGKTWALRALVAEWSPWAEFHYIADPDAFFVGDPSYMVDVLLHETYEALDVSGDVVTEVSEGGKWRVLVLEDTGELLAATAKDAYGQGLSRLLNVVDGMIGQGLRVLVLLTTNDELGDLHPAAVRPGRCASRLEFGPLSADEANAWLADRAEGGNAHAVGGPASLAELYALAGGSRPALEPDEAAAEPATCDCGHAASAHEDGDGACLADGCSCDQFSVDDDPADDAKAAEASVELAVEPAAGEEPLAEVTAGGVKIGELRFHPSGVEMVGVEVPADGSWHELAAAAEAPPADQEVVIEPAAGARASQLAWEGTLCPEGSETDDGRMFAEGSLDWRELPLSLMVMTETEDGHDGARLGGNISSIARAGSLIRGGGVFDDSDEGREYARLVSEGFLRGVSVDVAVHEFEIRNRAELDAGDGEAPEEPSVLDLLLGGEDLVWVCTKGTILGATVCPFPAFGEATIALTASAEHPMIWRLAFQPGITITEAQADEPDAPPIPSSGEASVTASAAGLVPVLPPGDWFADPDLEELTAIVVTEDGRVFGHAAGWDTCHVGLPGGCTVAPHSRTDYSYFHLGEIDVEGDGGTLPIAVGKITLDAPHASPRLNRLEAARHYDHTGTVVAHVRVGEDEHGIWVAGALHPDLPAETVRLLRGSTLSGDWRAVNGNLELVALLAVNVPGFPVPRKSAIIASAAGGIWVESLQATGIVVPAEALSPAELARFAALRARAEGGIEALAALAVSP